MVHSEIQYFYKMSFLKQRRIEPFLFGTMVLISIIPILVFKHFPTLDGPAHLYNSNLLGHLLSGDSFLGNYFKLNNISTPNWLGHFAILIFQRIFGSIIAEKIIVIICIAGLAYSFRFLLTTLNPHQIAISYLILPFTYSFFLFLGFFNFILSTALLFVCLTLFVKLANRYSVLVHISIIICLLLTYFAHPFGFFAFLLSAGTYYLVLLPSMVKNSFKPPLLLALQLASAIAIPCLLYLNYAGNGVVSLSNEKLPFSELFWWIYRLRSLVVFNFGREQIYTTIIFALIIAFIALIAIRKFNSNNFQKPSYLNCAWLISGAILLALYFILPNQINSGGYVSDRLNFLFFIFIIIWISTYTWNKKLVIVACVVSVICHIGLLNYYVKQISWLNSYAKEVHTLSEKIGENSIILPMGTPPDWMLGHISNYIGAEKKVVILENYEAYTGYFPTLWNWDSIPNLTMGNTNLNEICTNSFQTEFNRTLGKKVDYIIFTGKINMQNECKVKIDSILNQSYQELCISADSTFRLYKITDRNF